jgi:hypothetical protein
MKKAQSILEYVTLLCVVLASLLIMQFFIKRSYSGRLKTEANTLGGQYSPGHTNSEITTTTTVTTVSYTGGKTKASDLVGVVPDAKTIPDGMSVTYSKSNTSFNRNETVDSLASENE